MSCGEFRKSFGIRLKKYCEDTNAKLQNNFTERVKKRQINFKKFLRNSET